MRVGDPFLSRIVSYWDLDQEVFVMQGHKIELTLQDTYFLTRWPSLGVVGYIHLVLPHGRNITELMEHHCRWGVGVKGTTILLVDLERLETQAISTFLLRFLGSQAFHHVTRG